MLIVRSVLLALLICSGFACSAELQKAKEEQGDQQPKTEQKGGENAPLFISGEVTTKKDKTEADNDAKEREAKAAFDTSLVEYTFWLAVFTFLLFVAAAVQAGLFVWQLRLINRGEIQAKQVAEAAKASADAAKQGAGVASETLVISQRAWLTAKEFRAKPIFDGGAITEWKLSIVFENTGNTPAKKAAGGIVLMEVACGHELGPFDPVGNAPVAGCVVGPRGGTVAALGARGKDRLTMDQVNRLGRDRDVYLCGVINYIDIFPQSDPRRTRVCMRLSISDPTLKEPNPFGYNPYTDYNDAT